MDLSIVNIGLTILAGVTSVASPCVLPVIPIIVTGSGEDNRYRPLLLVAGLSITFVIMGVISSIFGAFIAGKILYIEKAIGILITLFGVLMILDINLFKNISFLSNYQERSKGIWSGFFLGLALGIIWIPCIGPVLSGVLALVATDGRLATGVFFLALYSIGFSIPVLVAGYGSQIFRTKVQTVMKHQKVIRYISGGVLILFGFFIFKNGMLGFAF